MAIPSYQIHNVLKNFSKRLLEEGADGGMPASFRGRVIDCGDLAEDGKRRAVTAAVTTEIFERLTRTALRTREGEERVRAPSCEKAPAPPGPTAFAYHLVDSSNQKITLTLSVEDPAVLIGRFEEEETAEQKSEPGPVRPPD